MAPMETNVEIINAFVDGETGVNPAGIVFDADAMNWT
jgi:predicted PhzF superfamily epimerase YddE/YHI9